jgi:hypothetical protein
MAAAAKKRPLGNAAMGANGQGFKVQDQDFLANPSKVTHG